MSVKPKITLDPAEALKIKQALKVQSEKETRGAGELAKSIQDKIAAFKQGKIEASKKAAGAERNGDRPVGTLAHTSKVVKPDVVAHTVDRNNPVHIAWIDDSVRDFQNYWIENEDNAVSGVDGGLA